MISVQMHAHQYNSLKPCVLVKDIARFFNNAWHGRVQFSIVRFTFLKSHVIEKINMNIYNHALPLEMANHVKR